MRYKEKLNKLKESVDEVEPGKTPDQMKEEVMMKEQNDPSRICGNIWFNGTDEQRKAFAGGTKGRGTDEKPPKAWWDDCVSKVKR